MPRRSSAETGFAIAPILYLLGLVGVGAGVLFSGYSQILRSNQSMSNTLAAKNDLQGIATTLAATSWLSNDRTLLCPPLVGSNSPSTPSANCSTSTAAVSVGSSFASGVAANRPASDTTVTTTGSPVEGGIFKAGSGVKVLDPWGHYYLYCRWENGIGSYNSIMIISAGANGKTETKCGDTVAGGDDLIVLWTTAVTQNRAAVWQTTVTGTAVTGAQFGQTGSQVAIDTTGDVTVPGTLNVSGTTTLGTTNIGIMNTSSIVDSGSLAVLGTSSLSGLLSGTSASFSSTLGVTGLSTLGQVSAGTTTLSSATVTNNATVGGTLGVTGTTTLGSTSIDNVSVANASYFGGLVTTSSSKVQIGTSVIATGSSSPLLTVGKGIGSPAVYPFTVDQSGNVTGSTFSGSFNGSLSGSQSGGTITATGFTTSGSFSSTGTGTATFAGPVTATQFNGNIALSGGGTTFSGVLPIANGGTGASTAASALSGLFSGAGTISGMIPGADLVSGSVTATQLNSVVTAGTYSTVTVTADGRVVSGTMSGGTVSQITDGSGDTVSAGTSGITFSVGSSTVGIWKTAGLMVGTSSAAVNKLDVYGAQAIGTGYAGVSTAPTNGLLVQGNVGIGTNNPGTNALQVNGTVSATNFVGNGSGLTGINQLSGGTANYVPLWTSATTLGTANLYQSGSNIGIGTTTAGGLLQINSTRGGTDAIRLWESTQNSYARFYFTNPLGTGPDLNITSDRIFLNGTVRVAAIEGNGTSTNLSMVGGNGTLNAQFAQIQLQTSINNTVLFNGGAGYATIIQGYNSSGSTYTNLQLQPNGGLVGIGTTSPRSKLDVYGAEVQVGSSGNTCSSTYGGAIRFSGSTLYFCDGSSTWQSVYSTAGGVAGQVTGSGSTGYDAIWTSATTIGTGLIYESSSKVGIGTATQSTTFALNGTQTYMFGTSYSTTGTQNDVAISSTGASVRYTGAGVATFNGIVAGANGQLLYLHNGSSSILTLSNKNAADTTVANQIVTGTNADMQMAANSAAILQYDSSATNSGGATGAWRVIGGSGGATPAGTTGQVQYNSGSNTLAATSTFTYISGNTQLVVGTGAATPVGLGTNGTTAAATVNLIPQAVAITASGAAGAVTVNTGATGQMAYFSATNTLSGTPNLYVSGANIALGTSSGTATLSLDGQAARSIGVMRDYTSATVGQSLTVNAGGAVSGGTNLNGGNLIFQSGVSTGTGTSQIQFQTSPGTAGATTDNTLATAMTINGSGQVGIGTTVPRTILNGTATPNVDIYGSLPILTLHSSTDPLKEASIYNHSGGLYIDSTGAATASNNSIYFRTNNTASSNSSGLINAMSILSSGNVGIGTTAPVEKLQVAGALKVTGLTSAITPSSAGLDYTTTTPGARLLSFGANAATKGTFSLFQSSSDASLTNTPLFIDSSGNVGIGTAAPTAPLQVRTTTNENISFHAGYTVSGAMGISAINDANSANVPLEFHATSYDLVGGNVGIGTSTAYATLDVFTSNSCCGTNGIGITGNVADVGFGMRNTSAGGRDWRILSSGTGSGVGVGNLNFYDNSGGGTRMSISNSGYVGVGQVSPHARLDVSDGGADGIVFGQLNGDNSDSIQTYIDTHYSDRTSYAGGCCNLLYLNQDVGDVKLGNTLYVSHGSNVTTGAQFISTAGGAEFRGVQGSYGWFHYSDGSNYYFLLTNAGDQYGSFNGLRPFYINLASGWVYMNQGLDVNADTYSNNYYHNSDRRLKDNIKPAEGLMLIEKLNGVTFNWKKNGKPSAGVIAQDVQKVMPEAVSAKEDGMLAVNTDLFFAPIIEAIKDLKKLFDGLKALFDIDHAAIAELKTANDNLAAAHEADVKAIDELRQQILSIKAALPQAAPAAATKEKGAHGP